jgi:hypothetical protein
MTAIEPTSKETAESFGPEAVKALKEGGEWEYKPESVEGFDAWAIWCETCKAWHEKWYVSGYLIQERRFYHVIYEVDTDGEWQVEDTKDIDHDDYPEWLEQEYGEAKRQEGWLEYARDVVETGKDPLGNYMVVKKEARHWMARLTQSDQGVQFAGAHEKAPQFRFYKATTTPADLPKEVRDFLCLFAKDDGNIYVDEVNTLDELEDGGPYILVREDANTAVLTFEVDIPIAADVIERKVREAARKHLQEKEKTL